ncbi:MAG: hypothetical protein KDC57_03735 [Saprospiraceae bacterium]|nr:hypothetical protein [Saprospiraceae bacterium]
MIRLIHQIRRELIGTGKVRRYLAYAVGEIVLVVIGILIALQINTWNAKNQTHSDQMFLLQNLKIDLQNDLKQISNVIEQQSARAQSIDRITLHPKDLPILDTAKYLNTGNNPGFFPAIGAYQSASNSGLLDQLNNAELKNAIYSLYESDYPRLTYNGEILDSRNDRVEWGIRALVNYESPGLQVDIKILNNQDLIDQMSYANRFAKIYINRAKIIKGSVENTLKMIDAELQKLNHL